MCISYFSSCFWLEFLNVWLFFGQIRIGLKKFMLEVFPSLSWISLWQIELISLPQLKCPSSETDWKRNTAMSQEIPWVYFLWFLCSVFFQNETDFRSKHEIVSFLWKILILFNIKVSYIYFELLTYFPKEFCSWSQCSADFSRSDHSPHILTESTWMTASSLIYLTSSCNLASGSFSRMLNTNG